MVASTVLKMAKITYERKIDRGDPFSVFFPCKKKIIKGKVTQEFKTWREQKFKGINFYAIHPFIYEMQIYYFTLFPL